jgi:hypothetical protein
MMLSIPPKSDGHKENGAHRISDGNDAFNSTHIQCTQNVQEDPFSATAGVGGWGLVLDGSLGIGK